MSGSGAGTRTGPLHGLGHALHTNVVYPGIVRARGEREVFRMLDAYRRLERRTAAHDEGHAHVA